MELQNIHKVLTITGFDGSGGAGIQADLKTFSALGCYGTSVLTALPVQNTMGVRSIYEIPQVCVKEQFEAILEDIEIDVVKIGMLHRPDIVRTITDILKAYSPITIVLDPVMLSKNKMPLASSDAVIAIKKHLFPLTTLLTPNLPEACALLNRKIDTTAQMEKAAVDLTQMEPKSVLVKGGHLPSNWCRDCLYLHPEIYWFSSARIETKNTHGTGCTLSAAIAAYLSKGVEMIEAVKKAKEYLSGCIEAGSQFKIGKGNGPVHHLWRPSC